MSSLVVRCWNVSLIAIGNAVDCFVDDYWTGSSSRRERQAIANPSANRINIITDQPNICSRYWRWSRRIAKMPVRRRTTDVKYDITILLRPFKE